MANNNLDDQTNKVIVPIPKPNINDQTNEIIGTSDWSKIGLSYVDGKFYLENPLFDRMLVQESSRGANLKSPKGAIGLMQIMPGTANTAQLTDDEGNLKTAGYGINYTLTKDELLDPVKNIKFAMEYFKGLRKKFGTDELALMAYNWGPGNVRKWQAGEISNDEVPTETINYIKDILGDLK